MKMASDEKKRRGEPVLLVRGGTHQYVPPLPGTIEWGSDETGYSIVLEPAGARERAQKGEFIPDPGGSRPLWERRRAEDGETVRKAAQEAVEHARVLVVDAAMIQEGYYKGSTEFFNLKAACLALASAERKLKAVTVLGVRHATE